MIEGPEAIDRLVDEYPAAGRWFGYAGLTPENFGRVLDQCLVIEDGGCWVVFEGGGPRRTLHWFCPHGADISAIRRILYYVFTHHGIEAVEGKQPVGHPPRYRRAARVLGRALGAERVGDRQVLTRSRFMTYSLAKAAPARDCVTGDT